MPESEDTVVPSSLAELALLATICPRPLAAQGSCLTRPCTKAGSHGSCADQIDKSITSRFGYAQDTRAEVINKHG